MIEKIEKVLLLPHNRSQFDVIPSMVQGLKSGLEACGVEVLVPDCSSLEELTHLIDEFRPDVTWGINLFVESDIAFEKFGIPHVQLSLDAMTYDDPTVIDQRHLIQLYVEKNSVDLLSTFSSVPTIWSPHAISQTNIEQAKNRGVKKDFDVVMLGTLIDHEAEWKYWRRFFSHTYIEEFEDIAEKCLENPQLSVHKESLKTIEESEEIKNILCKHDIHPWAFVNSIERYMRGLDRKRVLEACKNRKIHLFTGYSIPAWVETLPSVEPKFPKYRHYETCQERDCDLKLDFYSKHQKILVFFFVFLHNAHIGIIEWIRI